ncbi:hypothetical protein LCGC14_1496550 [marine sediment metagenome]|uniref:Uncharacterized protein n=1 Tax=marine sediment metagenome TaxID=412755 RepID=A0A0F9JR65_9ZZZZ
MVKKLTKKAKNQARVFAVPAEESSSGKHEVIFAADGDLNKGKVMRFSDWQRAEGFAHRKGAELGAKTIVHSYRLNPSYTTNYANKPVTRKRVTRALKNTRRITPKTPRLRK